MTDQLISFETAKLAKEKGFNIPCISFYEEQIPNIKIETGMPQVQNCFNNCYSAPTQSLLQKWLREVHNIHLNCVYTTSKKICDEGVYFWGIIEAPELDEKVELFEKYEDALEIGLQEALKLI